MKTIPLLFDGGTAVEVGGGGNDGGGTVGRVVGAVDPRSAEGDVELLRVLLLEGDVGPVDLRRLERSPLSRRVGRLDVPPGQLDDPIVLEVPRRGHHDVRARVAGPVIRVDVRNRDRADHLGLTQHPPAQRMPAEDGAIEHVVDLVLRLVLVHRDLLQHHLAL